MSTKLNLFLAILFVTFAFMAFEAAATGKKYDDPKWDSPSQQPGGSYTTNNLNPKIDINNSLKPNIESNNSLKSNIENQNTIKTNINNETLTSAESEAFNANNIDAASKSTSTGGNVNLAIQQNQVRQTPMAFAPNMVPSYSQSSCASSASVGISTPFGAIGGGIPIDGDNCDRRLDSAYYQSAGLGRVACERMRQHERNDEAMKAAGMTCADAVKTIVATPMPDDKFVTKQEFRKALDNEFRVSMTK
jgi:hypothetical protein